ncbi:MAG: hypothetical protein A2289_14645 [Deltaproteobacteria bacterium RIFOXYA12_FULL_58_15]|nr:MAG: hypothetical protein A2289_14645 [Deltaproteobacteria bacterium RIFOXYA12_FULL_58_15]OGR08205.1 MAG: hypothetical protein A2341_19995 [Deltaproteobacteria bacterium RIFOXYB12_FULL_58_9]
MIRKFNRFELKFIIPVEKRDRVCEDLARNMTIDSHGAGGFYRVTSLYYDTPEASCFWSKVEGIKYRRKVRVRLYGDHVEGDTHPVMVEIKQRINRTVQKRRVMLPVYEAYQLAEGHEGVTFADPVDAAIASEIRFLARSLQLRPTAVISYLRQAWIGSDYEPGLRITFDEDLAARGPEHGLGPGMPKHYFCPPEWLIMEVKADEAVPLWVGRVLARHDCHMRRISKYCVGLAQLRSLERSAERLRGEEDYG